LRNSVCCGPTLPRSSFLVELTVRDPTMILRALLCLSLFLVAALPMRPPSGNASMGSLGPRLGDASAAIDSAPAGRVAARDDFIR
jgi:hypothetical protein